MKKLTKQSEWAWAKFKYLHIRSFSLTKQPEWAWAKMRLPLPNRIVIIASLIATLNRYENFVFNTNDEMS